MRGCFARLAASIARTRSATTGTALAATAGSALAAASAAAGCWPGPSREHPDARWYREQAEHQAHGLSAVQEAKLGQWYEVARKCREGDPNEADDSGVSVLHLAAQAGKRQLVDILLGLGAKPGVVDHARGRTPLHYAAAGGHTGSMQALLEGGANPAAADTSGATALHAAAQVPMAILAMAYSLWRRRRASALGSPERCAYCDGSVLSMLPLTVAPYSALAPAGGRAVRGATALQVGRAEYARSVRRGSAAQGGGLRPGEQRASAARTSAQPEAAR